MSYKLCFHVLCNTCLLPPGNNTQCLDNQCSFGCTPTDKGPQCFCGDGQQPNKTECVGKYLFLLCVINWKRFISCVVQLILNLVFAMFKASVYASTVQYKLLYIHYNICIVWNQCSHDNNRHQLIIKTLFLMLPYVYKNTRL